MNSQLFFWINLIAALFFVWWFWSSRGAAKKPPALDLKKGPPLLDMGLKEAHKTAPDSFGSNGARPTSKMPSAAAQKSSGASDEKIKSAKNLNILFIYNGHDWDAYEVLGVPAGCSIHLVTQKYQELIKSADPGQLSFYEAAYEAILKKS